MTCLWLAKLQFASHKINGYNHRSWPSGFATTRKEGYSIPKDSDMKILQVMPKAKKNAKLKALLKATERELRGGTTTFVRQREGRWRHKKYPGWITWDEAQGGVLVAEVRTLDQASEWQLLQSFIGYLDRHLSQHIDSISITYR